MYLQLPVEGDNLNSDSPVCQSCLPARRSPPRRWSDGETHQPWLEGGVETRGQLLRLLGYLLHDCCLA